MSYMQSALQLLDDAAAPDDIGAHLDLAICRLNDHLHDSVHGNAVDRKLRRKRDWQD